MLLANPETDKFPKGYVTSHTAWLPPKDYGPIKYINYSESRPEFVKLFQNFRGGVGGPCSVYDPPFSCEPPPHTHTHAPFVVRRLAYPPAASQHRLIIARIHIQTRECTGTHRLFPAIFPTTWAFSLSASFWFFWGSPIRRVMTHLTVP